MGMTDGCGLREVMSADADCVCLPVEIQLLSLQNRRTENMSGSANTLPLLAAFKKNET